MITSLKTTIQDYETNKGIATDNTLRTVFVNDQPIIDVSANITNLVDVSVNNIVKNNWIQVNDASLNIYDVFEKTYGQINNLVHNINFSSAQNLGVLQFFIDASSNGGTISSNGDAGISIFLTSATHFIDLILSRHIPSITGKTLYVLNLQGPVCVPFFEANIEYGLRDLSDNEIKFDLTVTDTVGTSSIGLSITTNYLNVNSNTISVAQSSFNIDKIDGTGISEFNYVPNFSTQTLFILRDDNFGFIFGVSNGIKLIPIHYYNPVETSTSNTDGLADGFGMTIHRPFYKITKIDSSGNLLVNNIKSFRIYKDHLSPHGILDSYDISKNIVSFSEIPFFAIKLRDGSASWEYSGNIRLKNISIYTNKIAKFKIYYNSSFVSVTLTGSSFSTLTNTAEIDISSTAISVSSEVPIIYNCLLDTGVNNIDLTKVMDHRYFGFDHNISTKTFIAFSIENIENTDGIMAASLNWEVF